MARRPVVSYSDLTSGPSSSAWSAPQARLPMGHFDETRTPRHRKSSDNSSWNDQAHPSKKRKRGNRGGNPNQPAPSSQNSHFPQPIGANRPTQHWDHVVSSREDSGRMPYDDAGDQSFMSTPPVTGKTVLDVKKEGVAVSNSPQSSVSGPSTKTDKSPIPIPGGPAGSAIGQPSLAEIWDDSALIDAWEAANEEYKVMHGESKAWKTEPEPTSALWHNVSVAKKKMGSEPVAATDVPEPDAAPSLTVVTMPRTKEEVFQKAAEAWYWAGYWSGVYRTMESIPASEAPEADSEEEEEEGEEGVDTSDAFLPTQR